MIAWLARTHADVPSHDAWLGDEERAALARMRVPKRASDFRLGRWTARQALERAFGAHAWTVVAREDGSPEARAAGVPASVSLSISHADGTALAAVAPAAYALGCDVERIEPRAEAFVEEFFGDGERARLAADAASGELGASRDALVTVVWSAKESALKASRVGLRADPRAVEVTLGVTPRADGFRPLELRHEGRSLRGVWRVEGRFAVTLVAEPWVGPTVSLDDSGDRARSPTAPFHGKPPVSEAADDGGGLPCRRSPSP